ncbi:PTS system mannose/fructose/sorbose family transporter subunit IID [Collinsella sp. AGMB00827]|uniref:PTS system mannose/fructose/sorbose family transporter subunit IID n=1 Tax=Collinsella ureilytica TaxID=2869515 RepID=A0ABS7MJC9_9ACTN|nr:PTS system mannose/fructose/sorbose family transporter subunit IID [Collinsella urealyticum]MBY4797472.1 PTS system mannose/fructose/sorbose family transporter subunit IID [Collinsella urealyticum]
MASNEFVVPERYEDLTPAPQVDQATLNRMALRSCFLQSSFNFETMQSGGWLFAMLPGLEKVHTNKNDLSASMYHNLDFINTHPFLVTFVMGIVLSLEQNKVDTQTIRAVRISAASPLGGIGDALFWLTLVPITAGITSNMAIQGNAFAPLAFLIVFNVCQFALRFGLMNWSYKLGTSAIDALTANMQAFTRAASIMGVFIVGCLTVTMGGTQINLKVPNGVSRSIAASTVIVSNDDVANFTSLKGIDTKTAEAGTMAMTDAKGEPLQAADASGAAVETGVTDLGNGMSSVTYGTVTESPVEFSVADTLNTVLPKLVPLALVLMLYYLFAKHNFTPIKGIVLLLILGLLGAGPFGLWPSIW